MSTIWIILAFAAVFAVAVGVGLWRASRLEQQEWEEVQRESEQRLRKLARQDVKR